jgi:bacillithiol biosynthesis cysteine-adding enzyme BshC
MVESFFRSFLAGETGSQSLLAASFRDPQRRVAHVQRAAQRSIAPGLLDVLHRQNETLAPSDARARNLEALSRGGTAAVVTGQQLGLFLGPLFTFYKAASAIAAARALERESGIRCVPVFWMQTEDHDFREIDHCHLLLPDGSRQTLRLNDTLGASGQRVSVKHRLLGEDCLRLAAALEDGLGELPFAGEVLPLIRAHYRPGQSLAGAFAGLLATIFADEGLILLDPRDPAIAKGTAGPIYRRSLIESERIATALVERIEVLASAGFATQVHVRAASPLFFFHQGGPEGERFRLEREGDVWALVGTNQSISTDELLPLLEAEPLRFSSSALMRPILQDYLLPTAAYVGGPAEVSYFAQLPPLYEIFQLPMPLVIPRARFRLLEAKAASLLARLHLAPSDVEGSHDPLILKDAQAKGTDYPSPELVKDQLMTQFLRQLDEFQGIAESLDPGLLKAVGRTRATVVRAASRLTGRYERGLRDRDRVAVDRLKRLQSLLFPESVPQERYDSLPYFACKYGLASLKERVFASLDPFDGEVRDVQL